MFLSIEEGGGMNWKFCVCLVGIWLVIWLCMMKGIKIIGKVNRVLVNFNVEYNVVMKLRFLYNVVY